jgi:ornithine carbamoyltransferase
MLKKIQKPVNRQLKRVLKAAKKTQQEQQASYQDVVELFQAMPHADCVITDFKVKPDTIKRGLDRAIQKCGYSMTTHVSKGKIKITK